MATQLEMLLEAERRGILPEEKLDMLRELRSRSLPEAEAGPSAEDVPQQPVLTGLTGGMVTPETVTAATATLGTGLAFPTGPLGMAAGGALGAGAGPPLFDVLNNIARLSKGMKPRQRPVKEAFKGAGREAMTDLAFSAGAMGAGPLLRRIGKPALGKVLGVMTPQARRMRDKAEAMGISLGAAHVSPRKFIRGAASVLGIFPFVGTPLREGQARVVAQLDKHAADLLNTLAPTSTTYALGKKMVAKVTGRYNKTNRVASALYERFETLANNLSVREIVPTAPLKNAVRDIFGRQARGTIILTSGKKMKRFGSDELGDFLKQIDEFPEKITVEQARGLEREFNRIIRQAGKEGYDVTRLASMKEAMEKSKNSLDISKLKKPEADAVIGAWNRANEFFSKTRLIFETPTAKRFGRVERNIFNKNIFKPGTVNADEIFKDVFRARSPEALDDLRKLVGGQAFRRASRAFLADAFQKSHVSSKEGALVGTLFSAADFEKRLGLNTAEGLEAFDTMLRGSGSSARDWKQFLKVAKTATDITIRDPSTFLTRRIILGGGLMGGAIVGAGKLSLKASGLITWFLRRSATILMSKEQLRLMTRILSDTTSDHLRRTSLVRLLRLSAENGEPRRPTGQLRNDPAAVSDVSPPSGAPRQARKAPGMPAVAMRGAMNKPYFGLLGP